MSVKVRLRRMGNRNRSFYRIVVADSRTPTDGRTIESLGWYDPLRGGVNFKLDMNRVAYWQDNGAQFSNTVNSLVKQARSLPPEAMAPPAPPESVPSAESDQPAEADATATPGTDAASPDAEPPATPPAPEEPAPPPTA